MPPRLLERYRHEVMPAMTERFGYDNVWAVPRIVKVVVSMGMGEAHHEQEKFNAIAEQLATITGQKPLVTSARKAISNFRIRQGMKVGLKVTLRRERMYEFLDRLISLAIPRVRDFRGLSPSAFDGRGNYSMGLVEQTVFPEIDPSKVSFTQGMNIAVNTTASTDEEARLLLTLLGMPIRSS